MSAHDPKAAERQRRKRERQRDGTIVVSVEVPRRSRDVLVEARWLPEWSEDDKAAVAEAMQILVNGLQPVSRRDGSG